MKNLINLLLAVILLILPIHHTIANSVYKLTFFESIENVNKLNNYRIQQGIYGDFKVDSIDVKLDGNYRLTLASTVEHPKAFENNTHSRINVLVKLDYRGGIPDEKPFDELVLNARGEIMSLFNDGLYLKLDHLGITGKGMNKTDSEKIKTVMEEINKVKGEWYYLPTASLTENLEDDLGQKLGEELGSNLLDPQTLAKRFQDEGLKEAMGNLSKDILNALKDEDKIMEKDFNRFNTLISRILETPFFREKTIIHGRNAGFQTFRLDKGAIIRLVKQLAQDFGERLTMSDLKELRQALSKISLSGLYRINEDHQIFDAYLVKLVLRNIEDLMKLHLNYRFRIININQAPVIQAPADYVELQAEGIPIPIFQKETIIDENLEFENEDWWPEEELPMSEGWGEEE